MQSDEAPYSGIQSVQMGRYDIVPRTLRGKLNPVRFVCGTLLKPIVVHAFRVRELINIDVVLDKIITIISIISFFSILLCILIIYDAVKEAALI